MFENNNQQKTGGDLWFLVWIGLGMWLLLAAFLATRPSESMTPAIPAASGDVNPGLVVDK